MSIDACKEFCFLLIYYKKIIQVSHIVVWHSIQQITYFHLLFVINQNIDYPKNVQNSSTYYIFEKLFKRSFDYSSFILSTNIPLLNRI